jgi:hypothetical protein
MGQTIVAACCSGLRAGVTANADLPLSAATSRKIVFRGSA